MSVANSSIAQLYIAYFNRAPEPLGYDFWCDVLDNPVTLEDIASDFATQPEAVAMYPLLEARTTDSLGDFLTTVYQNLFDRDPDVAGLEFWTGVIQGGADFGTILLKIIEGASEADQLVLDSKANVAQYWVETASAVEGYVLNEDAIEASRAAIEAANPAANSLQSGVEITDAYFADAAQVALTTVENDVRPGVLLFNPLKVADIAVTGDDPEQDDTVLGLAGEDADQFEIVGTELFLKAGGIVSFGSDKMMDVVVTLDDTRAGHFRMDGAESGAGLTLTQADILLTGEDRFEFKGDDEFLGNDVTVNNQREPEIAVLEDGEFILTFASNDELGMATDEYDIRSSILDIDEDEVVGEAQVNTFFNFNQFERSVAALQDGGYVVAWNSQVRTSPANDRFEIAARVYDADGAAVAAEFPVSDPLDITEALRPDVAVLEDGRFVIVWYADGTAGDGDGDAIKAQIFEADGTPVGVEFQINTDTDGDQTFGRVTALPDGGFAVAWETSDSAADGDGNAIKARVFDEEGVAQTEEFLVNEFTENNQSVPDIATLANGNLVVTWTSFEVDGSDDGNDIRARIFDTDGDPVSGEFAVNTVLDFTQGDSVVVPLPDGGFVITWESGDGGEDDSGDGIRARAFDANGDPISNDTLINELTNNDQENPAVAVLEDGQILFAWESDDPQDGDISGEGIKLRIFELEEQSVQRVVADLNPDADFTYDPAEMVGIPVEPDGGIV